MEIIYKHISELTPYELLEIINLRQMVFTFEQNILFPDIDEDDYHANHLFLKINNKIISYLRVIKKDNDIYIGRVLTVLEERNKGYSKLLINYLKSKYNVIKVSAQVPLIPFYQKLDFKVIGNRYKEAGIFHQQMLYIK